MIYRYFSWVFIVIFLIGCDAESNREIQVLERHVRLVTKYSDASSGYDDPDGLRMKEFLECWVDQTARYAEKERIPWVERYSDVYEPIDFERLPTSLRNFWRNVSSIGWMSLYELDGERRFLNVKSYQMLKSRDLNHYSVLKSDSENFDLEDGLYYMYNRGQDDLGPGGRDVEDLLIVGEERDSVFISLIANERSRDCEYQAYWYSPHRGGVRVKSFAHLLVHLYLHDYQVVNDRDASMGHIYFFDGDWGDTCVPLLFDEAEIASWSVQASGRWGSLFGEIERN